VLNVKGLQTQGSFITTFFSGTFLFMNILFVVLAKLMDNMRNEVISEESDVNANFNRAKKKIWSDLWLQLSWLNTGMLILTLAVTLISKSEALMITACIIWCLGFAVIFGILARKTVLLNGCYKYESSYDDDDDSWIFGIFYHNPRDGRLNIERRDGMGATINMAHPLGKVISVLVLLTIIGSLASLVWVGLLDTTDIQLRVESGKVICHQFRDEYVIPAEDIREVSMGENVEELNPMRVAGVATEKLYKGRFTIEGEDNVRLFMDPRTDLYIRIKTDKYTYFINDNTEEETRQMFEKIEK
jgi:hypothetical protein